MGGVKGSRHVVNAIPFVGRRSDGGGGGVKVCDLVCHRSIVQLCISYNTWLPSLRPAQAQAAMASLARSFSSLSRLFLKNPIFLLCASVMSFRSTPSRRLRVSSSSAAAASRSLNVPGRRGAAGSRLAWAACTSASFSSSLSSCWLSAATSDSPRDRRASICGESEAACAALARATAGEVKTRKCCGRVVSGRVGGRADGGLTRRDGCWVGASWMRNPAPTWAQYHYSHGGCATPSSSAAGLRLQAQSS